MLEGILGDFDNFQLSQRLTKLFCARTETAKVPATNDMMILAGGTSARHLLVTLSKTSHVRCQV